MPRRGQRKPRPRASSSTPEGLTAWMKRYLEWLRVKNYSERTVENRENYLGFFIAWCEARSISRPQEVTKPILERYQRHLFHLPQAGRQAAVVSGRSTARLVPVRGVLQVADAAERAALATPPASSSCRGSSSACPSTC